MKVHSTSYNLKGAPFNAHIEKLHCCVNSLGFEARRMPDKVEKSDAKRAVVDDANRASLERERWRIYSARMRMPGRIKHTALQAKQDIKTLLRKKNYGPKVFCVGFHKTGTTSLGRALELLGYEHSSWNPRIEGHYLEGRLDKVIEYASKYESFDDLPWSKEDMIGILDRSFPGSKYIYLERDESSWKRSLARWSALGFNDSTVDVHARWKEYLKHREFILKYFEQRSGSELLILDVSDPIGFMKLADFLGKIAPQDSLPHLNKTDDLLTHQSPVKRAFSKAFRIVRDRVPGRGVSTAGPS